MAGETQTPPSKEDTLPIEGPKSCYTYMCGEAWAGWAKLQSDLCSLAPAWHIEGGGGVATAES